jgi:hypothetical protein
MMGIGTTAVRQGGKGAGKNRAAKDGGLLSTLDNQIMRHQAAISAVTGALAVLGVGAVVLGLSRVSPLLKVLWPF